MQKTITALFVCSCMLACGKGNSPPPAAKTASAPSEPKTEPTTATGSKEDASASSPAPTAIELPAHAGHITFDDAGRLKRLDFTIPAPKGWDISVDIGTTVDGSQNMYQLAAPGTGERPHVLVMGGACDYDCTLEAFDKAWVEPPKLLTEGTKILRHELLGPGVGILVTEKDGGLVAAVTRLVMSERPLRIQCIAGSATRPTPDMSATLLEMCSKLVVGDVNELVGGELLAREQAKLAQCPSDTTLSYVPPKGVATAFGPIKRALAFQARGGEVNLRFANVESAAMTDSDPGEGVMRLDLQLVAGSGQEVTSGTYALGDNPPMLVEASLIGAKRPAGDESFDPLTWSGPDLKVEVVARTKDKICGRFHLKDATHEARGEFNVDLKVGADLEP